ncbi:stage V sporulation protein AA [Geosporobacter ferrireducens]|uniref:stage V sporulation protein AA n=1 Tax=Geosporobacter ferrireducens TaxID=1424294 RepID=UPI000A97D010|nr:stage V sporulation protein AA [Geosporobacter ferrireducens]
MERQQSIYIQVRDGFTAKEGSLIRVGDIATLLMQDQQNKEIILNLPLLKAEKKAPSYIVVSILTIIEKIQERYKNVHIYPVGKSEILVSVESERKPIRKSWLYTKIAIVGFTLFVGTGLAIMNFHADVNMAEAHRQIYAMITGIDTNKPLILQIPYSLGIGIGMALFFNHIIPKKVRDEPSPMEVEMYSYKKGVNDYILNNTKNTEENSRS